MTDAYLDLIFKCLRRQGIELATGLSDREIDAIEERYGFRFPPDLRRFLERALPVSHDWVNWREESEEVVRDWLDRPAHGICFDIEYNGFWHDDWGIRPADLQEAFQVARKHIAEAPTLIPIYGHRFLPAEPSQEGNPVFSAVQTDIIYYGYDLLTYFIHELSRIRCGRPRVAARLPDWAAKSPRSIRFWSDFILRS